MYPDTDTPPVPIADRTVAEIRSSLKEAPWDREDRYASLGLDSPTAARLAGAPWAPLFDAIDPPAGATAVRLAHALCKRLPHHRRSRGLEDPPAAERIAPLVAAIAAGRMRLEATEAALDALIEEGDLEAEEIVARFCRRQSDAADLDAAVEETVAAGPALAGRDQETVMRWAMGQVMPRLLGRVDPNEARRRLEAALAGVLG